MKRLKYRGLYTNIEVYMKIYPKNGEKEEISTISLKKQTKTRINTNKIYPRETYDDIINRILDERKEIIEGWEVSKKVVNSI